MTSCDIAPLPPLLSTTAVVMYTLKPGGFCIVAVASPFLGGRLRKMRTMVSLARDTYLLGLWMIANLCELGAFQRLHCVCIRRRNKKEYCTFVVQQSLLPSISDNQGEPLSVSHWSHPHKAISSQATPWLAGHSHAIGSKLHSSPGLKRRPNIRRTLLLGHQMSARETVTTM